MCYGSGCESEILFGENAGNCGKKRIDVCPEFLEDEEIEDEEENE